MLKEADIIEGIEVFSDASIRIYQYGQGFDLPLVYAKAIKDIHTGAINSIAEHFTPEQLKAWQGCTVGSFVALAKEFYCSYLVFDDKEEIIGYALLPIAGFIQQFFIHPKHQFKGIGTILLTVIEHDPSNRDKDGKVSLNGNNASYEFYLKQGYSIIKEDVLDMKGVDVAVKWMVKGDSLEALN